MENVNNDQSASSSSNLNTESNDMNEQSISLSISTVGSIYAHNDVNQPGSSASTAYINLPSSKPNRSVTIPYPLTDRRQNQLESVRNKPLACPSRNADQPESRSQHENIPAHMLESRTQTSNLESILVTFLNVENHQENDQRNLLDNNGINGSEFNVMLPNIDTIEETASVNEHIYEEIDFSSESSLNELETIHNPGSSGECQMVTTLRHTDIRFYIIHEIYETEKNYYESLKRLYENHILKVARSPSSSASADVIDYLEVITFSLPIVLEMHRNFSEQLCRRLKDWSSIQTKIGDIFHILIDGIKSNNFYHLMIEHLEDINLILSRKQSKNRNKNTKERIYTVDYLLISIVQRMPKYKLLLKRLLEHTSSNHEDFNSLQQVLEKIHNLLLQIGTNSNSTLVPSYLNGRQLYVKDLVLMIDDVHSIIEQNRSDSLVYFYDNVMIDKQKRTIFVLDTCILICQLKKKRSNFLEYNKYKLLKIFNMESIDLRCRCWPKDDNGPSVSESIYSNPLSTCHACIEAVESDIRHILKMQQNSNNIATLTLRNQIEIAIDVQLSLVIQWIADMNKILANCLTDCSVDILSSINNYKSIPDPNRKNNLTKPTRWTHYRCTAHYNRISHSDPMFSISFTNFRKREYFELIIEQLRSEIIKSRFRLEYLFNVSYHPNPIEVQYTCASPSIGTFNLWFGVWNGFIGQIVVISMANFARPAVISTTNVCYSKINCLKSVPALTTKTQSFEHSNQISMDHLSPWSIKESRNNRRFRNFQFGKNKNRISKSSGYGFNVFSRLKKKKNLSKINISSPFMPSKLPLNFISKHNQSLTSQHSVVASINEPIVNFNSSSGDSLSPDSTDVNSPVSFDANLSSDSTDTSPSSDSIDTNLFPNPNVSPDSAFENSPIESPNASDSNTANFTIGSTTVDSAADLATSEYTIMESNGFTTDFTVNESPSIRTISAGSVTNLLNASSGTIVSNTIVDTNENVNNDQTTNDHTEPVAVASIPPDNPTMWFGTDNSAVYIYSCFDAVSNQQNKFKIQLNAKVQSIEYFKERVFVGLANHTVAIFTRDEKGFWKLTPQIIQQTHCYRFCVVNQETLWTTSSNLINIRDENLNLIQEPIVINEVDEISFIIENQSIFLASQNSSYVYRYSPVAPFELLASISISFSLNKDLNCGSVIRYHRNCCLNITSMHLIRDRILIGTSAGLMAILDDKNTLEIVPTTHSGQVRFIISTVSKNKQQIVVSGNDGTKIFLKSDMNAPNESPHFMSYCSNLTFKALRRSSNNSNVVESQSQPSSVIPASIVTSTRGTNEECRISGYNNLFIWKVI